MSNEPIGICFSAALTERAFKDQFCLVPSLGMIKRDVQGCQGEEKIDEGGRFPAHRRGRIKKRARGIKKDEFQGWMDGP